MTSIMQTEKECWITKATTGLHKHHIFFGTGNRKLSEKYGCWVWLRGDLHNLSNGGVHYNRELDLLLKRACQREFMEQYPDLDFMQIFGRNYLEEYA